MKGTIQEESRIGQKPTMSFVYDSRWLWALCPIIKFDRNEMETVAPLEVISGYSYSTLLRSIRDNFFISKSSQ